MKLKYDNLEDARTKLLGTYCMYKKKAAVIKHIEEEPGFKYTASGVYMISGREIVTGIDDPEFNCSHYNIGYVNCYVKAAWFYRIPMKQYRQGLKHDQVKLKCSQNRFSDISFGGKNVAAMLENDYPKFDKAVELLKAGEANIVAFHKDFAMTYDSIHEDFIVEYKGTNIGFSPNKKDFSLGKEFKHLAEPLKEAVG